MRGSSPAAGPAGAVIVGRTAGRHSVLGRLRGTLQARSALNRGGRLMLRQYPHDEPFASPILNPHIRREAR